MIWSCPERVIAKFSYQFNQIGKELASRWNRDGPLYYTAKATPDSIGSFMVKLNDNNFHIIENDVSNWDGSLCHEMIMLEKAFLEKCVQGMPEEFEFLLSNWGRNQGRDRTGLTVDMQHGRRSGDLWTSVFNSFLNVMLHKFIFGPDVWVMVMGDDSVCGINDFVPSYYITQSYLKLGMKCEPVYRDTISEVCYCSGRMWPVENGYKWGNFPFKVFSKLGLNHHNHSPQSFKSLLYGTARGMLCSAGHVPILGAFLRAITDSAEESGIRAKRDNRHLNPYRIQGGNVTYPSDVTYYTFSLLYDISPIVLMEIEEWIEINVHIDNFPYSLDDPVFIEGLKTELGFEDVGDGISAPEYRSEEAQEEKTKLTDCKNIMSALHSAAVFGRTEDTMLGNIVPTHTFLHMLFTFMSWLSFPTGVALHKRYNQLVRTYGGNYAKMSAARKRQNRRNGSKGGGKKRNKPGFFRRAAGGLLKLGGGLADEFLPGMMGKILNKAANALATTITGHGDYNLRTNSLINANPRASRMPNFSGSAHTSVRHAEFVGYINSSVAFSEQTFELSPTNVLLFPWLSSIANNYEKYRLHGACFMFVSTSASAIGSTNTALGEVMIATQYDVNRNEFASPEAMKQTHFVSSGPPSEDMLHGIECNEFSNNWFFTDPNSSDANATIDRRFHDCAEVTIGTYGAQAASVIGELYIIYDIEFSCPSLPRGGQQVARLYADGYSNTDTLGSTTDVRQWGGDFQLTLPSSGAQDTFTFPDQITSGIWWVQAYWFGTSAASLTTAMTLTNCSLKTSGYGYLNDTTWQRKNVGTSAYYSHDAFIEVTGPGPSVTIDTATLPTSGSGFDLYVVRMPDSLAFEGAVALMNSCVHPTFQVAHAKALAAREEMEALHPSFEVSSRLERLEHLLALTSDIVTSNIQPKMAEPELKSSEPEDDEVYMFTLARDGVSAFDDDKFSRLYRTCSDPVRRAVDHLLTHSEYGVAEFS
jgi:hypothetical protein